MAGAVLTGFAPAVGVVAPSTPPAFVSWPLLLLLAVLAPALSLWLTRKGRTVLAASLLLGPAALAPGRIVLDSQLAVDAGLAARPELMLPVTLVRFTPSAGLWMLMCGNVATVIAGVFAMISLGRARDPVPDGFDIDTAGASRRQGQLAFVLCVAVLGAVSVLMPQFVSGTPYLVPRAAVDSPLLVLAGSLLIAVAVPTVGGFVAGATDREMARGGLLGLAIALAAIVIPPLAAATFVAQIHYDSGGVLGLVAALAMVGLAWSAGRTDERVRSDAPRIPSLTRLLALTGGLAVIAGVLAVVGAMSPQWELPSGISTVSYPARMLWPSGLVMVVLGGGVLLPATALRVRPVLSMAWVVVPLAATAALDTVFAADEGAGASAGSGAWEAGVAGVLATLAGVAAAFAGAVERDDVDLTEVVVRRTTAVLSLVVFPLAVATFGLPVLTAPGFTPPGLFMDFEVTSWGLVLGLAAVLAAIVLAPLCRPERAAALLCGAALIVLMRIVELPLTAARAAGSGPGAGLWWALACVAALVVGVIASLRRPKATVL